MANYIYEYNILTASFLLAIKWTNLCYTYQYGSKDRTAREGITDNAHVNVCMLRCREPTVNQARLQVARKGATNT